MVWSEVFLLYKKNFKASLAFGILLVFVFLFSLLPNTFLSSGTMFLDYGWKDLSLVNLALEIILLALFLMFYSVFTALVIFGVRKELSTVRLEYYLSEMLQKFAVKVFSFYALYALGLAVLGFLGLIILSPITPFAFYAVNLVLLLASAFFLFVPQAIVIDEAGVRHAVYNNFEFIRKSPGSFLKVSLFCLVFLAVLPLIEMAFDSFAYSGKFVSLLLTLVFFIPFLEVLKSHYYMLKYDLVRPTHAVLKAKLN